MRPAKLIDPLLVDPVSKVVGRQPSRGTRLAAAIVLLTLVASALVGCNGDDDQGSEQAFCALLAQGIGLGTVDVTAVEFERLDFVAPPEIRTTVGRLRNSALDYSEIDPLDLEARFNARFDPDALAARSELETYASDQCGLNLEGPAINSEEIADDLEQYLQQNFGDATWIDDVEVDPGTVADRLDSLVATFARPPAAGDEAGEVCRALAVYLFTLNEAQGTIEVRYDGESLAFRPGPDQGCELLG